MVAKPTHITNFWKNGWFYSNPCSFSTLPAMFSFRKCPGNRNAQGVTGVTCHLQLKPFELVVNCSNVSWETKRYKDQTSEVAGCFVEGIGKEKQKNMKPRDGYQDSFPHFLLPTNFSMVFLDVFTKMWNFWKKLNESFKYLDQLLKKISL